MVNPPVEYTGKQIIISQLPHEEISKCKGQKRVANLGDFFTKMQICGFFWKVVKKISFSVKYYKNMTFFSLGVGNLVCTVPVLINYKYQAMNGSANPILFKFSNEKRKF
jgi:hypothetical protein